MVRESERGDCRKSTAIVNRYSQTIISGHSEDLLDGEPTTRYVAALSFGCDEKVAKSGRATAASQSISFRLRESGRQVSRGVERSFRRFENCRNVEVPQERGRTRDHKHAARTRLVSDHEPRAGVSRLRWFSEFETRARLFAFFPLSGLIIPQLFYRMEQGSD